MSKFVKMYLVAGILYGLVSGLFYGFVYSRDMVAGIVVGVIGGVVFGLIQASIVTVFAKITYHVSGCLLFLLSVIVGITGCFLGLIYFWGMSQIPQGKWTPLRTPPETVVEILDDASLNFWGGVIHVRTVNNTVLTYDCYSERECNWLEVGETGSLTSEASDICPPNYRINPFLGPLPPGKVVDSQLFHVCGPDFKIQYNFILLEDGSLWEWDRYSSGFEIIFYPLMAFSGMIVGLVSSLVVQDKKIQGIRV